MELKNQIVKSILIAGKEKIQNGQTVTRTIKGRSVFLIEVYDEGNDVWDEFYRAKSEKHARKIIQEELSAEDCPEGITADSFRVKEIPPGMPVVWEGFEIPLTVAELAKQHDCDQDEVRSVYNSLDKQFQTQFGKRIWLKSGKRGRVSTNNLADLLASNGIAIDGLL